MWGPNPKRLVAAALRAAKPQRTRLHCGLGSVTSTAVRIAVPSQTRASAPPKRVIAMVSEVSAKNASPSSATFFPPGTWLSIQVVGLGLIAID
jgi:hypothetical protein